ncbi:MAG: hypothetical protein HZA53_16910 [Planctomycetes bacterium]|nr:hypothetical protein [Planctomycetota bacterium]
MFARRGFALAAGLCALAAVTTAFTFQQLSLVQDNQNLLRTRLEGQWTLNTAMTRHLQPELGTTAPQTLGFTNDPKVMERLVAQKDRLAGMHLFQSGMLTMDGKTYPYVVTDEHGNATLIYFQTRSSEIGAATSVSLALGVGRPKTQDLLFYGGAADGTTGASAYQRSDATVVATPASGPVLK